MLKKTLFILFLITPFVYAGLWTATPAIRAAYACHSLGISKKEILAAQTSKNSLDLRRKIQKFFLDQQVYIPFEDIFLNGGADESEKKRFDHMIAKTCGKGDIFIWVPFKFRLPMIGDRILEWCFTPNATS